MTTDTTVWQIGDWIADPSDDSLSRDGATVKLEPRLMQLLVYLAGVAPRVVSIEQILDEVWKDVVVGSASVYQSISQLRKVLGDSEETPRYIETVARKGYRLIAPARPLLPARQDTSTMPAGRAQVAARAVDLESPAMPPTIAAPPSRSHKLRWISLALAAVLVAAAGAWWLQGAPSASKTSAIVVLPFADLSRDKSGQAFCDGLTEELTNWIAQLPSLDVVARTSAVAVRAVNQDVREIGRKLGVTHVLEGSVRSEADVLRITVKLATASDGYEVWTESFDAEGESLLAVQEQIARAVASNLAIRLTDDTLRGFAARRTASDAAYRLFLTARYHQQRHTRADNEQATALYRQVVQQDPNFALAYTQLAMTLLRQRYYEDRPVNDIAKDVEPLLQKAAALQPQLPELYVTRGVLNLELLKSDAAARELARAIELNPNSIRARSSLGLLTLVNGNPRESLSHYTQATKLDPLDGYLHAQRCMALQDLAQFAEAHRACARARTASSSAAWPYTASAWLAEAEGKLDEALEWNASALERSPDLVELIAQRGLWLLAMGEIGEANETYVRAANAAASQQAWNPLVLELRLQLAHAREGASGVLREIRAVPADDSADPVILFELASGALIARDDAYAKSLVDRALAHPSLQAEALDDAWLGREGKSHRMTAAIAMQRAGNATAASTHAAAAEALRDRLAKQGVRRHGLDVLGAQIAAVRGDHAGAIRALRAAASAGWTDLARANREPAFDALRSLADYQSLTTDLGRALAPQRESVAEAR
jgi:TolB-like protein/DNA-binding winged helix-turn-helix (wHTH) protein